MGRKPLDTSEEIHNVLNKEFKSKFGWNVRDGIFTSFDMPTVGYYGDEYLFFPIGDYKYCYSDEITDLFSYIVRKRSEEYPLMELYYIFKEPQKYYKMLQIGKYKTEDREELFDDISDICNFYHIKYNDLVVTKEDVSIIIDDKIKNVFFRYTKHEIGDKLVFRKVYETTFDEFYKIIYDEMIEFLKSIVLKYNDVDILKMSTRKAEITFNCRQYYLVDVKYKNIISGWFKDKGWFK